MALRSFFSGLSLDNYRFLGTDPLYIVSYVTSLQIAAFSTLFLLLIGYPIAYAMTRAPKRAQAILVVLVILPFWTSFLIRIYAWMNILQHDGPLNQLLMALHIVSTPPTWLSTTPRSISASSIPICRSWCCRSMRRWRNSTSSSSKPPPISAARAGRHFGSSRCRCRRRASSRARCSASSRSSASSSFPTCSAARAPP